MATKPTTVKQFLASLPADRRVVIGAVREVILENLGEGYEEGIQYGMLGYFVPHSVYPGGYHCDPSQPLPFVGIGNNKSGVSLHMFCLYCDAGEQERFVTAWKKTGKKLDMGKACVRFKSLEDVPLAVVGRAIKRMTAAKFVKSYEGALSPKVLEKVKKAAAKRAGGEAVAAKKTAKKKVKKKAAKTTRKQASK